MLKVIMALLFICVSIFAKEITSFNDVQFGSSASTLNNSKLLSTAVTKDNREIKCYIRTNENLIISNTELLLLSYCYVEDKMFIQQLIVKQNSPIEPLKAIITKKFDRPFVIDEKGVEQMTDYKDNKIFSNVSITKYKEYDAIFILNVPNFNK